MKNTFRFLIAFLFSIQVNIASAAPNYGTSIYNGGGGSAGGSSSVTGSNPSLPTVASVNTTPTPIVNEVPTAADTAGTLQFLSTGASIVPPSSANRGSNWIISPQINSIDPLNYSCSIVSGGLQGFPNKMINLAGAVSSYNTIGGYDDIITGGTAQVFGWHNRQNTATNPTDTTYIGSLQTGTISASGSTVTGSGTLFITGSTPQRVGGIIIANNTGGTVQSVSGGQTGVTNGTALHITEIISDTSLLVAETGLSISGGTAIYAGNWFVVNDGYTPVVAENNDINLGAFNGMWNGNGWNAFLGGRQNILGYDGVLQLSSQLNTIGGDSNLAAGQANSTFGTRQILIGNYNFGAGDNNKSYGNHNVLGGSGNSLGAYNTLFTGSISGTALTIGSVQYGTVSIGETIVGPGIASNTNIVSGSGTSWVINNSQNISSQQMEGALQVSYSLVEGSGNVVTASGAGTGDYVTALGVNHTISNSKYFIATGDAGTAGSNSFYAMGGGINWRTDKYGQFTRSSGKVTSNGDNQWSYLQAHIKTTDATATNLGLNGGASSVDRLALLVNNTTWKFRLTILAAQVGTPANHASWVWEGHVFRTTTSASTTVDSLVLEGSAVSLVNGLQPIVTPGTATAPVFSNGTVTGWTVAVSADTTNGGLITNVVGAAGTTIIWSEKIELVEVSG